MKETYSSFTLGFSQEQQQRRNTGVLRYAQNDDRFKVALQQKQNGPKKLSVTESCHIMSGDVFDDRLQS